MGGDPLADEALVRSRADQPEGDFPAVALAQQGERVDQHVEALHPPELAEVEQVRGIRLQAHGLEFAGMRAVADHPHRAGRGGPWSGETDRRRTGSRR